MDYINNCRQILEEIRIALDQVSPEQANAICEDILRAKRIFVAAAGRSLLVMRAFAMRLMHLGFHVYVAGDTTTPAISKGDLLIAGSGSGETATLKVIVDKAKKHGARVDAITIYRNSAIAQMADAMLTIPAATNQVRGGVSSWQPGGSAFEQCLLILLDSLVIELALKTNVPLADPLSLHANLE